MKISVVTAVLNRAHTIEHALRGVQAQTYRNLEHVIQDGASTDGTLDVIARLADARARVVSSRDGGIYQAINAGIARASGDVIGLMHSDDVYASDSVLDKVAAALRDPAIDGVYGDLQYVTAGTPARVVRHWRAGRFSPAMLRRGWMPPHPTLYLRRHVFERFGAYDTSYRIAADYDAILRWLGTHGIRLAYIPEVLVKMRVGGESNRSLGHLLRKSREDYRAIRRHRIGGAGVLIRKNVGKLTQFRLLGAST